MARLQVNNIVQYAKRFFSATKGPISTVKTVGEV